jgi:type II secretory pathway component PulC
LLIILGVVVLLAIYTFFIRPKPKVVAQAKVKTASRVSQAKEQIAAKTNVKEVAKTVTQPIKSILGTDKESAVKEPVTEKGNWGADPFIRDWVLSEEIKDLKLKAVTQSGTKAYALINDQILETGELIQGKKIVAINKDNVILEQGDRKFTLLLGQ